MANNFTTMTVGTYVFEFNFDTRELRISRSDSRTVLNREETIALGDFLAEVLSTGEQGNEDDYEDEDEEAIEGDGSGLHQCPYCYDLVTEEHEEFCSLNPKGKAAHQAW